MNQQFIQNNSIQAGGLILDADGFRKNPQPTLEIFKKSVNIGFNYFSSFTGQKVIVTGASKGIGISVAKTLLDAGAYVALVSKNKIYLDTLAKSYPGLAFPFNYDITDPYELNVCFKKIVVHFKGEIDILINCHAQYYCKNFEETTLKDWDDCMNENCRSMVHFTSLAVPFLENSVKNKSIVFLTQNVEDKPIPGELIYAVSKSMVNMFIKCLALELADSKVRVNGVASNFNSSAYKISKNIACSDMENKIFLDTVSEIKPLQNLPLEKEKIPTNEEIANVLLWLASSDSSFVTGEIITVDDGMSLTSTYPKLKSQII